MPLEIRPLTANDLPDLRRFLNEGFHAPEDSTFAAEDVLAWKYLDPRGAEAGEAPRSLLARVAATGRVVGHVGVCPSRWHGGGLPARGVSTLHMMDWLASADAAGVGATLMRRAHQATETQFGLGGSAAGRGVIDRGGYGLAQQVPVHTRVLRPLYRMRDRAWSPAGRALRAAKDVAGRVRHPARRSKVSVRPRRVESFGTEVLPLLTAYENRALFTTREPDLLNHMLRFPRGGLTGWHLEFEDRVIGLALLAVVSQENGVRVGRLAEWLLAEEDPAFWHASATALTRELTRQGADLAQGFASTPWAQRALVASGFVETHRLEFRLRDRSNRLPAGVPFHLSPLEADYAYV
ncbi:MAG: acetyltransferase [Isosphaeraceae bacterium]